MNDERFDGLPMIFKDLKLSLADGAADFWVYSILFSK